MVNLIAKHIDIWTAALTHKSNGGRGRGNNSNGQSIYGIKKLRELILELAVRGKLVPQDPNDEPASVLLEKVAKEKALLIKEGKIKKQNPLPKISEDEKPFELPLGWEWARVGGIAQHNSGKTLDSRRNSGLLREYITTSNLYWGYFILDNLRQMPISNDEVDKCTATQGDLLICEGGEAGRTAVWNCSYDICFQNHIHRVRLFCDIDSYYVYRVFQKMNYSGEIDSYRKGVGISNISGKVLSFILIPIPPVAEQHRIVAKVDELMALCDKLEQQQTDSNAVHQTLVETLLTTLVSAANQDDFAEAWQRIANNFDTIFTTEHSIDQLKQTILQLAVMGKLVPQDPNDEPASVLLEKIAKEKARLIKECKIRKQVPFPKIREDEKLFVLPIGWDFVRFGDATYNRDAERVPLSGDERRGRQGNYDYYGASGIIDCIDEYLFDKPLLLIGEDGANLINRSTPIAFMARGKYWVNNHAHVIDGLKEELLSYICLHINAISLEPYVTGTAQPKMNQAKMNSIVLALPPFAEQHRIVSKVDELMALCETLKSRLIDAQTTQVQLADAIVEQAVA